MGEYASDCWIRYQYGSGEKYPVNTNKHLFNFRSDVKSSGQEKKSVGVEELPKKLLNVLRS